MNSVSSISVHAMPRCSNNSRNAFTYLSVVNFCVNVRQKFSFTQFTSTSMGVGFALGVAILDMPCQRIPIEHSCITDVSR